MLGIVYNSMGDYRAAAREFSKADLENEGWALMAAARDARKDTLLRLKGRNR